MKLDPVEFDSDEEALIRKKMLCDSFTHDNWGIDDFESIRKKIKQHYITQQGYKCAYCKQDIRSNHGRVWDVEHIIPKSAVKDFMFEPKNLCVVCIDCNFEKKHKEVTSSTAKKKYPDNSEQYFIAHPHFDRYEQHVNVIEAGMYYLPFDLKGEKTIEVCRLNRFWQFAGYGDEVDVVEEIAFLSDKLASTKSEAMRDRILKEITAVSLKELHRKREEEACES